jgi:hypothetical protein
VDVRRLRPRDGQIGESIPEGTKMSALFHRGKGAAFWGPFVIHVVVPEEHATRVREHIRNLPAATDNMFELATQAESLRAGVAFVDYLGQFFDQRCAAHSL